MSGPLISVPELAAREREGSAPALLDVRWALGGPPGVRDFLAGHIPGAAFVDLDTALAAPPGPAGRHPLPDPEVFEAAMRRVGVSDHRSVVVYDAGGGLAAARAWWLLRYFGHPSVAVLDGGLAGWVAARLPVQSGPGPEPGRERAKEFVARPGAMPMVAVDEVLAIAEQGVLIDARAGERFRGQSEPIDPVAGHIPGARNRPTTENIDETGRFRPQVELRQAFERLGVRNGVPVAAYCGSGITAAHEVLALELAGFRAAIYPGSWSEWIADPGRPVARA